MLTLLDGQDEWVLGESNARIGLLIRINPEDFNTLKSPRSRSEARIIISSYAPPNITPRPRRMIHYEGAFVFVAVDEDGRPVFFLPDSKVSKKWP